MNSRKKHISITTANDVNSICTPLFNKSPVSYFRYEIIYKTGTACLLCSSPDWQELILTTQLYTKYPVKCPISPGYHLAENIAPERVLAAKDILKINSGLSIIREFKHCYESTDFGVSLPTSQASEFYMNNRDMLENFVLSFKDKAAAIIKEAIQPQNLIATDDHKSIIPGNEALTENNPAVTRYFFDPTNKLSQRETDCLTYMLRGRSARETAQKLNVSPKAVEMYISRVLVKLDCDSRKELFDKAIASSFMNIVKNSIAQ